jgi:uncharacterized membrane protein YqjE
MTEPAPHMRGGASAAPAERSDGSSSQGLGEIVGNIATDVSDLLKQETELAKLELKEEASKASKVAGMFGGAGAAAHIGALFVSAALAFGLSDWFDIDLGWTALIVGVLWLVLAGVLFVVARNRMRSIDPIPHQAINSIKKGM